MRPFLPPPLRDLACDALACLRFYTRLPVPVFAFEPDPHGMLDFGRAIRALPLVGLAVGGLGALTVWLATLVGLPAGLVAAMALAKIVAVTGVFHEDGLADTADGFGGGATIARKLEIMKDSRIGSYGAAALGLSLLLRWSALDALVVASPGRAALALIGMAAVARVAGLVPLALLPPARKEGAAYAADRPRPGPLMQAALGALLLACLPALAGAGLWRCLLGCVLAGVAGLVTADLSRRQIGGQTGDVAGAAEQGAEIAYLAALLLGTA